MVDGKFHLRGFMFLTVYLTVIISFLRFFLHQAIECGWLPGDLFDGLPCKYVNGAILCEVRKSYKSVFYICILTIIDLVILVTMFVCSLAIGI